MLPTPKPDPQTRALSPLCADFIVGLNLPWIRYGGDFGSNAWQPEGGLSQAPRQGALHDALARVADSPVSCLRWFLLCDGRAGLAGEPASARLQLDTRILSDLDVALEALARHRLQAMFVLFDFMWCSPPRRVRNVVLGGRRRWLFDAAQRERLLETVVGPIVGHCARHEAVFAWDLMNEPEWLVRWRHAVPLRWTATTAAVTRALADLAGTVRACSRQPVTVGLANHDGLSLVRGIGLDFYQVHWYDRFGLDCILSLPVSSLGLDRPIVLGEYPTRRTLVGQATVMEAARRLGYAGAFGWSLLAGDEVSSGVAPALADLPPAGI